MMKRRTAIGAIIFTSAGVALFPSCVSDNAEKAVELSKIKITGEQANLLTSLTQTIIPATDTPGAKEEKTDEYILRMVNDCASPEDQQKFLTGLEQFEKMVKERYGKSFASLSDDQKNELLTSLEDKKGLPNAANEFYGHIKGATVQFYTGSEYYMTTVMNYNIIPKRYKGCVLVAGA
jgi:Gluconate 2-dehydrogenase subunit 3